MAIFGLDDEAALACRQALDAAGRMASALDGLNESMSGDLDAPFAAESPFSRHGDRGRVGFDRTTSPPSATRSTRSRLETLTKEFAVELVVSEELLERAGLSLASHPCHDVETRGRQGRLAVRAVARANDPKIFDFTAFHRE
jgi:adenylate cyclase